MASAVAIGGGPTFTWGGSSGNWNVGANWLGGSQPSAGANILVDGGNPNASVLSVNITVLVGDMQIDSNDRVRIINGNRLQGLGTFINNGVIRIDSSGGSTYLQPTTGLLTLTGGGTIELSDSANNWIYKVTSGGAVVNVNNTIVGAGRFGWSGSPTNITNQAGGTVIARGANPLLCETGAGATIINQGVFQADAGTLSIQGNFDNTDGLIEALNASQVNLNVANITAGTFNATGTGAITVIGGTTTFDADPVPVVNNATIRISNSALLHCRGSLVNNGVIRIDSTGSGTYLRPTDGPLTLSGGGTIELSDNGNNWIYKAATGGELINVDNTIIGAGRFGWSGSPTNITNQAGGTVIARGTQPLIVESGTGAVITNQGVFRADSGTLQIQGVFDNTDGLIEALDASQVNLNNANITAGTFNATGTGAITVIGGTTTFDADPVPVVNNATIRISNSALLHCRGSLVNNGVIRIDATGSGTYLRPTDGPLTLTGGGTIELSDNGNNWIYKAAPGGELINVDNTIIGSGRFGWVGSPTNLTNEAGGTITAQGASQLQCESGSGATITNRGLMNAAPGGTLRLAGTFDNAGGTIAIPAGANGALGTATITSGVLKGAGTITTISANSLPGVTIRPGDSAGRMTISGVLPSLNTASTLEFEIGGATPVTQHDVLTVSGAAVVNGTLRGVSLGGFNPAVGNRFTVLTASNITGNFSGYSAAFVDPTLNVRFERPNASTGRMVVVRIGDMNCDGFITVGDISGFVLAITDAGGYASANPGCELLNADINGDSFVTVGDIGGFVGLLTGLN
ncbi:MAG: hypothetical protein SF069_02880 [Phycisphaerae bacterium]|nr:hypothetical protein [Phycisphaerae bacterium]